MMKQHTTTPNLRVFKLIVPCCASAEEWCTYMNLQEPRPDYKGRVEDYPPSTVFRIQEIKLNMDELAAVQAKESWPLDVQTDPFTFTACWSSGYVSDKYILYPDVLTGLSAVQHYLMDRWSTGLSFQQGITCAALYFLMKESVVVTQARTLTLGNFPYIRVRSPHAPVEIRVESTTNPLLPSLAMHGPFPVSIVCLCNLFLKSLEQGTTLLSSSFMLATAPFGALCVREEGTDTWKTTAHVHPKTKQIHLPHGVSIAEMAEWLQEQGIGFEKAWNGLYLLPSSSLSIQFPRIKLSQELDCWDTELGCVVSFATMSDYLLAWKEKKLVQLVSEFVDYEQVRSCLLREREFIREISGGNKFQDEYGRLKRKYIDETTVAKRSRLEDAYGKHGPECVNYLWNIPFRKITVFALLFDTEEEKKDEHLNAYGESDVHIRDYPERACGRDLWVDQLRAFQETPLYQSFTEASPPDPFAREEHLFWF